MYTYTCHHQITLWLKDITRIDRSDVMYYFFNVVLLKLSKIYLRHLISVNNARQSIEFFFAIFSHRSNENCTIIPENTVELY